VELDSASPDTSATSTRHQKLSRNDDENDMTLTENTL